MGVMVPQLHAFKDFQIQIEKVLEEIFLKLASAVSSFTRTLLFQLFQFTLHFLQQNTNFSAV